MRRIVNVELDVRKEVHNKISFAVNQYDDVTLKATLYDGLDEVELNDEEIIISIKKEDGTYVSQDASTSKEGNTIVVEMSKQFASAEGVHELELALKDKNGVCTTAITKFMVKKPIGTGIVDIVQSANDIHLLFEIKEFLEKSEQGMKDIEDAIKAVNIRIDELKASLQGEYDKLVIEMGNKKDELIEEISNKKDDFIADIDTAKNDAIVDILDQVDIIKDEAVKNINDTLDAGLEKVEEKIQEGKDIVNEINQIKDTLATKQELSDTNTHLQNQIDAIDVKFGDYTTKAYVDNQDALIRDRINQVNNRFADYATIDELNKTYTHIENKKADRTEFDKLKADLEAELKSKANIDDVARVYATHKELEATEERLQNQIDAITGVGGGIVSIQDLQNVYDALNNSKLDKADVDAIKLELTQYTDAEIAKLDAKFLLELTNVLDKIAEIERDYATKQELKDVNDALEAKKADKAELQAEAQRLQHQIDAITGVAGGVASLKQLEDTYNHLNAIKADITYVDGEIQRLENAMNTKDQDLQQQIDAINAVAGDYATKVELQQSHNDLDTRKADKTDLTNLETRVTNVETNKADKTELAQAKQELENRIDAIEADYATKQELETAKTELEAKIDTKADKTELATLENRVQTNEGKIALLEQNKADKTALTDLENRVSDNETNIADLQTTKADKTYVDNQDAKLQASIDLKADQTEIVRLEAEIATKANQADLNTLEGRVSTNETDIANLKTDKADKTELTEAEKRLQDQINALNGGAGNFATRIELQEAEARLEAKKADKTALTALENRVGTNETAITNLETIKADKSYVDNAVANSVTKQYVDTATNDLDTRKADRSAVEAIDNKVTTIEVNINNKADQADLQALEARVTTNEGNITNLENTKADRSELDNYVSDVLIEDGVLKQTKAGTTTEITKVISKWGDLEYVNEYPYANLFNSNEVVAEKYLDGNGDLQANANNLDWGVIKIPVRGSQEYTLMKKTTQNNFKISMRDVGGQVVGNYINQPHGTVDNGWYRHVFTTHQDTAFIYIEVRLRADGSGKEMLIEGTIPAGAIEEIPYLYGNNIIVGKEVSIEFDRRTSSMTSTDMNSAILELDTRITNLNIPNDISDLATDAEVEAVRQSLQANIDLKADRADLDSKLSTINGYAGVANNIDLTMEVVGDNFNLKVAGNIVKTLPMMTEAQEREIIALFV